MSRFANPPFALVQRPSCAAGSPTHAAHGVMPATSHPRGLVMNVRAMHCCCTSDVRAPPASGAAEDRGRRHPGRPSPRPDLRHLEGRRRGRSGRQVSLQPLPFRPADHRGEPGAGRTVLPRRAEQLGQALRLGVQREGSARPDEAVRVIDEGGQTAAALERAGGAHGPQESQAYYAVVATDEKLNPVSAVIPGQSATDGTDRRKPGPIQPIKLYDSKERKSLRSPTRASRARRVCRCI